MKRDRLANLTGWIATLPAAGVLAANILLPRGPSGGLRWAGVVLLVCAVPLMFLPFVLLPRYGETARGRPYYETTRLADRGLYGLLRHPQYLGYMLLVLGFAALSQHPLTVALAVLAVGFLRVQAGAEERALRRRFGADWDRYASRVPCLNILAGMVRRLGSHERENG